MAFDDIFLLITVVFNLYRNDLFPVYFKTQIFLERDKFLLSKPLGAIPSQEISRLKIRKGPVDV